MMDFAKRTGQAKLCDSLLAANPQLWKKFQPGRHRRRSLSYHRGFWRCGSFSEPTPPIPAGTSVDVLFPLPPNCLSCKFKITVDSSNQVDESNELNNTATGTCSLG